MRSSECVEPVCIQTAHSRCGPAGRKGAWRSSGHNHRGARANIFSSGILQNRIQPLIKDTGDSRPSRAFRKGTFKSAYFPPIPVVEMPHSERRIKREAFRFQRSAKQIAVPSLERQCRRETGKEAGKFRLSAGIRPVFPVVRSLKRE